jgi:RNA polymerase sigma factor (sigma-70 family)
VKSRSRSKTSAPKEEIGLSDVTETEVDAEAAADSTTSKEDVRPKAEDYERVYAYVQRRTESEGRTRGWKEDVRRDVAQDTIVAIMQEGQKGTLTGPIARWFGLARRMLPQKLARILKRSLPRRRPSDLAKTSDSGDEETTVDLAAGGTPAFENLDDKPPPMVEMCADPAPSIESLIEQREEERERQERMDWLAIALRTLTTREREIIHLRLWEKQPFRWIANSLGISEVHARVIFLRANRKLKESALNPPGPAMRRPSKRGGR